MSTKTLVCATVLAVASISNGIGQSQGYDAYGQLRANAPQAEGAGRNQTKPVAQRADPQVAAQRAKAEALHKEFEAQCAQIAAKAAKDKSGRGSRTVKLMGDLSGVSIEVTTQRNPISAQGWPNLYFDAASGAIRKISATVEIKSSVKELFGQAVLNKDDAYAFGESGKYTIYHGFEPALDGATAKRLAKAMAGSIGTDYSHGVVVNGGIVSRIRCCQGGKEGKGKRTGLL